MNKNLIKNINFVCGLAQQTIKYQDDNNAISNTIIKSIQQREVDKLQKYCNNIPPFEMGEKIVCIQNNFQINYSGKGVAQCLKDQIYILDDVIWSQRLGWVVSISGELHKAEYFKEKK